MNHEIRTVDTVPLSAALLELGLTPQETGLYAVSLALGPSPMNRIAEHLALARPNVYKLVRGLEEKGLAHFSEKKKYSRTFMVESPSVVLEKLRERRRASEGKEQALVAAMPDLLAAYRQGELDTKVRLVKGKKAFIGLFEQLLEEEKKELRFCGSIQDLVAFISDDEERRWVQGRLARNIAMRCLVLPSDESGRMKTMDTAEMRETRLLAAQPFSASFELFANKAVIWQPTAPLALVIEDEYIVAMLSSLFGTLWVGAKS